MLTTNVSCVCTTNVVPLATTQWYAAIPTTNQAWLVQMTNYLKWMETYVPSTGLLPYGNFTTNNSVRWLRRTNSFGNAQWVAQMPVVAGQVWQIRYTRTCEFDSAMSLGSDIVNGQYEYTMLGSLATGLIYARRIR